MVMNADRIAELRRLCEAATPGPWEHGMLPVRQSARMLNVGGWGCGPLCSNTVQAHADGSFIAAARTALPEALDEVVRLRAALRLIAAMPVGNEVAAAHAELALKMTRVNGENNECH